MEAETTSTESIPKYLGHACEAVGNYAVEPEEAGHKEPLQEVIRLLLYTRNR